MEAMLRNMHNPAYRDNIGGKVEELKKDPEIGAILEEIQEGGPAAMMKYVIVLSSQLDVCITETGNFG